MTVLHADGVRTTYSFLGDIDVAVGQRGAPGRTGGHQRRPPAPRRASRRRLLRPAVAVRCRPAAGAPRAVRRPAGRGRRGRAERDRPADRWAGACSAARTACAGAVGTLARTTGSAARSRTIEHYASRFTYPASFVDAGPSPPGARGSEPVAPPSGRAPRADEPIPPHAERRVAVLVAGLGSNSDGATIDAGATPRSSATHAADVVRFSYAGGRVPDPADGCPVDPDHPVRRGRHPGRPPGHRARLADLSRRWRRRRPGRADRPDRPLAGRGGRPRSALIELERRHGAAWLAQHRAGGHARDRPTAVPTSPRRSTRCRAPLRRARSSTSSPRPPARSSTDDGASMAQLSETSDLVEELAAHPVPDGDRGGLDRRPGRPHRPGAATAGRPGMDEVIVPLIGAAAHSDLPGSAPRPRGSSRWRSPGSPPGLPVLREALWTRAWARASASPRTSSAGGGLRSAAPGGRAARAERAR